jgi:hypothetical protein
VLLAVSWLDAVPYAKPEAANAVLGS